MAAIAVVVVLLASVGILIAAHRAGVPVADPFPSPEDPDATAPVGAAPGKSAMRITGNAFVQQHPGQPAKLCVGAVGMSLPATCLGTVPVDGLDLTAAPWLPVTETGVIEGSASVTGIWRDGTLLVETLAEPVLEEPEPIDFPQLCSDPKGDQAAGPFSATDSSFEQVDGYQQLWITYPTSGPYAGQTLVNLATLGDQAAAEARIRRIWTGPLCLGSLPGPTSAVLRAAQQRVTEQLGADRTGPELLVLSVSAGLANGRNGLDIGVFLVTDEMTARMRETVGDDVWPWTSLTGQFRVVA